MLTDMELLKAHGAAGFTDDGIPLKDSALVKKAMEEAVRLNVPLSFHEEDPTLITNNGINHGAVSEHFGIGGSPAAAEDVLVARDCMLAPAHRCPHRYPAYQLRALRPHGRTGQAAWRSCHGRSYPAPFQSG